MIVYPGWPLEVYNLLLNNPPNDRGSISLWRWFGAWSLLLWVPPLVLRLSPERRTLALVAASTLAIPYFQSNDLLWLLVMPIGWIGLLGNLGYLQFGVWELILRLWPIFLVALGLDLMIGHKKPWNAVAGVAVGILATAGIVWLVLSSPLAVQLNREAVTFPKGDLQAARGTVTHPVGKLSVGSGAAAGNLLEGDVAIISTQSLRKEIDPAGSPAYFELSASGFSSYTPFTGSANQETWDIKLNDKVSYSLTLKTAVGEQAINLTGLTVSGVTCEMAVGRQVMTLPGSGAVKAEIRSAIGEVIIYVPRGAAVQVRVEKAITALDAPADFTRSGSMLVAPGAAGAAEVMEVSVHNAIGRISVQYLP